VTSDWKWTGPAGPMLVLGEALRARGHEVAVGCPEAPPEASWSVAAEARQRGLEQGVRLGRGRGIRPWRDGADARRLASAVRERDVGVVHAWHTRAHGLALRALRGRRRPGGTALVRSLSGAPVPAATPWSRWLFGPGCDGLVCVGEAAARRAAALRGGRPVCGVLGAVEPAALAAADGARFRAAVGLPAQAPVIGVVARLQRHRRFELLFEAFALLGRRRPDARLLVLGRGTHADAVAQRPVDRLGLGERVFLAGHRGADYPDALAAMDLLTYLVPGSDGTCRALQEAAAAGVPAVATRRGALPELVEDGRTGVLVEERPSALAEAWERLLDDPARRAALGAAARRRAREVFAPEALARAVEALYAAARAGRRAQPSRDAGRSSERATSSR